MGVHTGFASCCLLSSPSLPAVAQMPSTPTFSPPFLARARARARARTRTHVVCLRVSKAARRGFACRAKSTFRQFWPVFFNHTINTTHNTKTQPRVFFALRLLYECARACPLRPRARLYMCGGMRLFLTTPFEGHRKKPCSFFCRAPPPFGSRRLAPIRASLTHTHTRALGARHFRPAFEREPTVFGLVVGGAAPPPPKKKTATTTAITTTAAAALARPHSFCALPPHTHNASLLDTLLLCFFHLFTSLPRRVVLCTAPRAFAFACRRLYFICPRHTHTHTHTHSLIHHLVVGLLPIFARNRQVILHRNKKTL